MCAMLRTWRTGSMAGKELFNLGPQLALERGIWGERGDPISDVMGELELAIGQQQGSLRTRPHDIATQTNLTILHELRSVVVGGLSDEVQLKAILNQVRTLVRNAATTSAPPLPLSQQTTYKQPSHNYWNQSQNAPSALPVSTITHGAAPPAPPTASSSDILSILTNLAKSGIVPSNGTAVGVGTLSTQETTAAQPDSDRIESRSYRESILAHSISLTTSDTTTPRNNLIFESLYESQPAQCKQCGERFAGTPSGKKQMEKHLDMHFVQNRQASQQAGRGDREEPYV